MSITPKTDFKLAARLRTMADNLSSQIEDKRRPMSQNWTRRRAAMYESRLRDADHLERVQCALYALAAAHEQGTVPSILRKLRTKALVEQITTYSSFSKWSAEPLLKAGISEATYDEARTALLALANAPDRTIERAKRELETKIRGLVGQIPGYFPTPEPIARLLVQHADIRSSMLVLEPSAGSGNLARVIRELHPDAELKTIEWNQTLRQYLELDGFMVIGSDFLDHKGQWDRIIQNPPFEKRQDVQHVQHAYDCLAPGGRIVSILAGTHWNLTQHVAEKFNGWLEGKSWEAYELPEGAFKESGTSVRACYLVLDR